MFIKSFLRLFLIIAIAGCSSNKQPVQNRPPAIISPEVSADKTVTFRYRSRDAKEVKISAQFEKEQKLMTRDTSGLWSITLGPVKPDIYPYSFFVDGVQVMDPSNMYFFPNERFKGSLVDIPGDTALIHSMQDVPHGTVNYDYYNSKTLGITGTLVVYTPPGYEKDAASKYPVFYLIGGTTDTEETWFKVGRTNLILDNLIAQGKAKPMIVVMPYGNPAASISMQTGVMLADPVDRNGPEAVRRANLFGDDLIKDVIPYIDATYRTLSDNNSRAIGGFSRGGGQTLRVGLKNLDKFSWICCYSAYLGKEEFDRDYKNVYSNPARTNKQLKLLWVSVGDNDQVVKMALVDEFLANLKSKNINYERFISSGGHTWMNTKLYLAKTAQLLFK